MVPIFPFTKSVLRRSGRRAGNDSGQCMSFRYGILVSLCLIWMAGCRITSADEELRVLAWDGYADPSIVKEFERRTGATVGVTYVSSDDELWTKLNNGGRDFDVFAVNTAELQRYIDHGLSVPIDMDAISNHKQQKSRFQNYASISGIMRNGKTYAVPYAYSEMGLIYNRKLVKYPPQSFAAMWSPEYRGRVLAFDTSNHNFTLAGQLLGVKNPFHMTNAEMGRAARLLVKLRRNVLTFYKTADEATNWFRRYNVALIYANYGTQQVQALRKIGADIGYVIPREGALAWLDCWAISKGVRNRKLAERWINYTLEKSVSQRLTTEHGLANTITHFPESEPGAKIIWLQPLENPARRKALWDKIMSGDSIDAF
jgi:putative spermidine/putrescine transport system substrate-binding protein